MVDRRTFTAMLAATFATPAASFGKILVNKTVFYSAVGSELTPYGVDIDGAMLSKQTTVSTPANIQYAWPHPSKKYLYVVSSSGGPARGRRHGKRPRRQCLRDRPRHGRAQAAWRTGQALIPSDPRQRRHVG